MKQYTILLVEDNAAVLEINREALSMRGYRVIEAENIDQAQARLDAQPVDLIVLDILLPDGSGLDFCLNLRVRSAVPILFLSALAENSDIIRGLRAGGDDYLPKPYDLNVLIARIEAVLRREALRGQREALPTELVRGPLTLDLTALSAQVDGQDAYLTPREFALLLILVQAEGRVVPTRELYASAWGLVATDDLHAVRVQISRLRKKLGAQDEGWFEFISHRGIGYQLKIKG